MTRRIRTRAAEGFTLPELLVGITLLGTIFVALTGAFVVGLRNTRGGDVTLAESNAVQLTSHRFTTDVHGAEQVVVRSRSASCGGPALLELASPAADRVVKYAVVGRPAVLVRRVCSPAAGSPSEQALVTRVRSASAACAARCVQVDLRIRQTGGDGIAGLSVTLRATRRLP